MPNILAKYHKSEFSVDMLRGTSRTNGVTIEPKPVQQTDNFYKDNRKISLGKGVPTLSKSVSREALPYSKMANF
jgi:hypothetical protein